MKLSLYNKLVVQDIREYLTYLYGHDDTQYKKAVWFGYMGYAVTSIVLALILLYYHVLPTIVQVIIFMNLAVYTLNNVLLRLHDVLTNLYVIERNRRYSLMEQDRHKKFREAVADKLTEKTGMVVGDSPLKIADALFKIKDIPVEKNTSSPLSQVKKMFEE